MCLRASVVASLFLPFPMAMPRTLRSLLTDLVDYAGLFPPASLSMDKAVEEYARVVRSPHEWMLGRFICPASRLAEFEKHASPLMPGTHATSGYREHAAGRTSGAASEPWRVSVLLDPFADAQKSSTDAGPDAFLHDLGLVHAFNDRHEQEDQGLAVIDMLEIKVRSPTQIDLCLDLMTEELFPFFEFPVSAGDGSDSRGFIAALSGSPAGAKIRTGGVTQNAFPTSAEVASFLSWCAAAEVPFKATAGLHHPVRGSHALTYEKDSQHCTMHGFLNLFTAAAMIKCGKMDAALAQQVLDEEDPANFKVSEEVLGWKGYMLEAAQVAHAREAFAHSFGSCSFEEPVEDLRKLGFE